jgi:hypothetical protein
MAFAQLKKPEEEDITEEYFKQRNKEIERITNPTPPVPEMPFEEEKWLPDLEDDFDPMSMTYPKFVNKYYPKTPQERKKDQEYSEDNWDRGRSKLEPNPNSIIDKSNVEESLTTDEDEKRMDIIGQNGNDGLHYEKELYLESQNDIDLNKIDDYLNTVDYVEKKEIPQYNLKNEEELVNELSRLTDTTKTLIVDKEDSEKKERVLRYDKTKRKKDI